MNSGRRFMNLAILGFLAIAATFLAPTSAMASATQDGHFCSYSLSTHKGACFRTEAELLGYRAEVADYDLVAFYNWINYSQGGGYQVYSGDHACTAAYDNIDYRWNDLSGVFYAPAYTISLNNTVSSVSTYVSNPSHCDIRFYEGTNLTGDSSVFIDHCMHLATCTAENWYDRASSFILS